MRRLELSVEADSDLDQLLSWGASRFGDEVAADYYASFEASFALLVDFPRAGSPFDGRQDVRVLKTRSHRIFYRIEDDRIFIARILHHAANATNIVD